MEEDSFAYLIKGWRLVKNKDENVIAAINRAKPLFPVLDKVQASKRDLLVGDGEEILKALLRTGNIRDVAALMYQTTATVTITMEYNTDRLWAYNQVFRDTRPNAPVSEFPSWLLNCKDARDKVDMKVYYQKP